MSSWLGIARRLYGEADFPGFPNRQRKVLVFYGNPIRKRKFVGSLVLRFDERRSSGVVSGYEIFLRSIEGDRLVGIVRDFHDTGSVFARFDGIFEFQGGNTDSGGVDGGCGNEEEEGGTGPDDVGNAHNRHYVRAADSPKKSHLGLSLESYGKP